MRTSLCFLLLFLSAAAQGFEWRSDIYSCSANLPESAGWKVIEAPVTPGITVVVAMQNPDKQAVFGINIVENLPGTDLADPAVRRAIEDVLQKFSYQSVGHSTVKIGGREWLQYPVQSGAGTEKVSGVLRFTSAGGRVFSITALRGGGQEAAQDVELQQAAASFRILEKSPPTDAATPAAAATAANAATGKAAEAPDAPGESTTFIAENRRLMWYVGGGIVALLILAKIIGGRPARR